MFFVPGGRGEEEVVSHVSPRGIGIRGRGPS